MPTDSVHHTLPARYYTSAQVFAEEMERFYFGSWICAGRAAQIDGPGDYFLREVAGESIIITRDTLGDVHAFYNVCRHRGTRMCTVAEGRFDGRIQCPYHGWTYGLDGTLKGTPDFAGVCDFNRAANGLVPIEIATWLLAGPGRNWQSATRSA